MKSVNEGKNVTVAGEIGNKKNSNNNNNNTGKSVRVRPQNPFKLIDCEKFLPVPCYSGYSVTLPSCSNSLNTITITPSQASTSSLPTTTTTTCTSTATNSTSTIATASSATSTSISNTCVSQSSNNSSVNTTSTTIDVPSPGSSDSGCSSASSILSTSSTNGQVNTEAPFTVMISVEVLAIIDIHAHCVSNEVIGLLGGRYCPIFKQLHVLVAEPCKSISASTTDLQCEMDPVSQTEAAGKIFSSNNFVIGWYHSHPTFVPNPSLRDLETQGNYQGMFQNESNVPFIAIILSPYSGPCNPRHKHTLVSKFKCLMLSDQINPQVRNIFLYTFTYIKQVMSEDIIYI